MTRFSPLLAEWADLVAADGPVSGEDLADTLLRACDGLSDEVLRALPASPDGAAAALTSDRFADRVDGVYLPIEWLESFCAVMRLPIAEIDSGWDISDGEDVYFCPRTMLADDPDSPDDRRAFVRVDQIRRWES
ncbi:MAG: hypothetical protein E6I75_09930 [Chloroflexi bacterium]|nr:MAG: hypothetical protein E6I75_09930 [Chloroflexota bacterium]TME90518.1 MAG: hypothetical protein E6I52_27955 [Chloroflexota bacterium]